MGLPGLRWHQELVAVLIYDQSIHHRCLNAVRRAIFKSMWHGGRMPRWCVAQKRDRRNFRRQST